MSRHEPFSVPRPRTRHSGVLILGVLVGLLWMHGLGFVPAVAQMGAHPPAPAAGHAVAVMDVPDGCGHDIGGGQGHPEHADATCASGAVAGSPALLAPLPSPIGDVARGRETATVSWSRTDGGREPPSLSALQLLRI